ncbi:MAG: sialate O-acetylesterase [Verrucomicrobiae bacterium]|nr:sialate O-acetylesterase [Verrucomicrobiae bacterium]
MKRIFLAFLVWIAATVAALAVVRPHALFTDNAVLQQGERITVWGTAGNFEDVTVIFGDQKRVTTARDRQRRVTLSPMRASAVPRTMIIKGENTVEIKNVVVGEVWVASGQSNMQWPLTQTANGTQHIAAASDPHLRLFTVPRVTADTPQRDVEGSWQVCTPETVANFSAVAYFFGRDLRRARNVPVGLIHSSWGGTPAEAWTAKEVLEAYPMFKRQIEEWELKIAKHDPAKMEERNRQALLRHKEAVARAKAEGRPVPPAPRLETDPAKSPHRPSVLYNAMIHPLLPFAIRGVIWYQGESNNARAREYRTLFPAMIRCWRERWKLGQFPFLFVQIAPHQNMTPELREAQFLTAQRVPNTAMVVITDYGDPTDIHPRQKEPVGARLALAARALAYGEPVEYSGPVYRGFRVRGNEIVLSFGHVGGGLEARGGSLRGFTIAGADKNFVPATARIEGNRVVVSNPAVVRPVAVRYGWENVPDVNLYNKAGLPASPFRTDVD